MSLERYKALFLILASVLVGGFVIFDFRPNVFKLNIFDTCWPSENTTDSEKTYVPKEVTWMVGKSSMCYTIASLINLTKWTDKKIDDRRNQQPVHIVTQWYQDSNMRRRKELVAALHMNLINKYVTKIHLLQPKGVPCTVEKDVQLDPMFPMNLFRAKVVVYYVNYKFQRLTFERSIRYANEYIEDAYAAIINLDSFFDSSLSILSGTTNITDNMVFYLSRHEVDPLAVNFVIPCSKNYVGSHDALLFKPPVSSNLARILSIEVGTWHAETKVIYEFVRQGYIVRNICNSLRIWHLHSSQVRNRLMPAKGYLPYDLHVASLRHPESL